MQKAKQAAKQKIGYMAQKFSLYGIFVGTAKPAISLPVYTV